MKNRRRRRAHQVASSPADSPAPEQPLSRWRRVLVNAAACGLVALYGLLASVSARDKSPTYDEPPHLTGGYTYWKFHDYRLQPENGNLPQRWVALPLLFLDLRFPSRDTAAWRTSDVWTVADQFFHESGNDVHLMLRYGRAMTTVLGGAVCCLVFVWARRLLGDAAGLMSLFLCALCPTMLAHGQLATSDMCTALFFTLAVGCIWRVLERVSITRVLTSTLVVGLLFLSKASAPLILSMTVFMTAAHYFIRRKLVLSWRGKSWEAASLTAWARWLLILGTVHALVAWSLVWTAYGWRFSAQPEGEARPLFYKSETMAEAASRAGTLGGLLNELSVRRVLPEAYLYGIAFTLAHSQRSAFLNGDYSVSGWTHYFPYSVLVKTPLAVFGLLIAWALWGLRHLRSDSAKRGAGSIKLDPTFVALMPLFALLSIYWVVSLTSSLNIGQRHMLPTYPAMFILAGGAVRWLTWRTRGAAAVVAGLLAAFGLESARAYPHYLAYFNPLVSRERAYFHLVDSNLDWGQDLPGLKRWLDEHTAQVAGRPLYLAYFGVGSPEYYGIQASPLPVMDPVQPQPQFKGGVYCISATALANLYGGAPGRWNAQYESIYRQARAALEGGPGPNDPIVDKTIREKIDALETLVTWLHTARLFAYLRHRTPNDHMGYSILIFNLTDAEVQAALNGPPAEFDELSWAQRTEGD